MLLIDGQCIFPFSLSGTIDIVYTTIKKEKKENPELNPEYKSLKTNWMVVQQE